MNPPIQWDEPDLVIEVIQGMRERRTRHQPVNKTQSWYT